MIKNMKSSKGFTLIELIMVIVLLGIMAAVAIPTFIDLKQDALDARKDGAYGALVSEITILHAQYLLDNTQTYTVASVAGGVTISGGSAAGAGTTVTVTWDDAVVNTYTYGPQVGFAAGTLSNP